MKRRVFRIDTDGFSGKWYPASASSSRGLIVMLGDSSEDYMVATGAKWEPCGHQQDTKKELTG